MNYFEFRAIANRKELLFILFASFTCYTAFSQMSAADFKEALLINSKSETTIFRERIAILEKIYPKDPKTHFLNGTYSFRVGKTAEAISYFSAAINDNPNFSLAYVARATVHGQNHDFESAINDISKAVEQDKSNLQILQMRAQYYLEIKNYDLALQDICSKIKLDPQDIANYTWAAKICMLQKQTSKAESFYAKAFTTKNIDIAGVTIAYGQFLMTLQRFDDAIVRYIDAINLDEKQFKAIDFNNLAVAYLKTQNVVRALYFAEKAQKMAPLNFDFKGNLASIYLMNLDFKKAKETAKNILLFDSHHVIAIRILEIIAEKELGQNVSKV